MASRLGRPHDAVTLFALNIQEEAFRTVPVSSCGLTKGSSGQRQTWSVCVCVCVCLSLSLSLFLSLRLSLSLCTLWERADMT